MGEEVKVLGVWASPFSRRVELALRLKGVQYEFINEDLRNKSPLLLKSNPVHKKIPVLIHNGKPTSESLVIVEYIDETWQHNPLLPKDPYERAQVRFWVKFVDEKIGQTGMKAANAEGKEQEQLIEELAQQFKLLENELKGKDFFGGDAIGYLDLVAFITTYWTQLRQEVTGFVFIREEKFPILCKWLGKISAVDAVKESLPPREKHVAFVRARIEAKKVAAK